MCCEGWKKSSPRQRNTWASPWNVILFILPTETRAAYWYNRETSFREERKKKNKNRRRGTPFIFESTFRWSHNPQPAGSKADNIITCCHLFPTRIASRLPSVTTELHIFIARMLTLLLSQLQKNIFLSFWNIKNSQGEMFLLRIPQILLKLNERKWPQVT